jgi:Sulfate permease family
LGLRSSGAAARFDPTKLKGKKIFSLSFFGVTEQASIACRRRRSGLFPPPLVFSSLLLLSSLLSSSPLVSPLFFYSHLSDLFPPHLVSPHFFSSHLSISPPLNSFRHVKETYTPFHYFAAVLPCLHWLRAYRVRRFLLWDLAAGASVAALVVPQGMAYARLAGLPQEYGLYGAFVPVVAYAALGSSRHLSVGPVVITSLVFGSSLPPIVAKTVPGFRLEGNPNRPLNPEGQTEYNRAAIQVAFLAGLLYTAVGVFRLSFFINFLSHSVIAGFMTGAAVTIMTSQLRNA